MWLVNLLGFMLIGAIIGWFWWYKPKTLAASADGVIQILVSDGVYQPSRIRLPLNRTSTLRFVRKDASPCAGTVIFRDFDINAELPVERSMDIPITPTRPGRYDFNCPMQMYRGELIVVEEEHNP